MPKTLTVMAAVAATLCCTSAEAAGSLDDIFSISGFGTVGFTYSSEDQADFTGRYVQPTGAGASEKWGYGVDSRMGLQVNGQFTTNLSVVVQGVVERQYDNEFRPGIEWANIKYQFTPDWSVRLGRVVAPTYLYSESSKIGYSNLWVRPPVELYRTVIFTNVDGVETSFRKQFGNVRTTLQAEYGQTDVEIIGTLSNTTISYDTLALFNATIEWDALTVRLGFSRGEYDATASGATALYAAFNAVGLGEVGRALGGEGSASTTYGIGVAYDRDSWVVTGELSYLDSEDSAAASYVQGYVSAGVRLGSFTPYLVAAMTDRRSTPYFDPALAAGNPIRAALIATANGIVASTYFEQTSVTAGFRWDLQSSMALKLQASQVMPGSESHSTLTNFQPGFETGQDYTLVSAAIDFVF